MNSIKLFLTSTILAIIALAIFISAIQGYSRSMLTSEILFDSKLDEIAQLLASIEYSKPLTANQQSVTESEIKYRIWSAKETLLSSSRDLNLPEPMTFKNYFRFENFSSSRWRTRMKFFKESQKWVWVAERQDFRFELAEGIILESIIPALVVIPLLGVLIVFIVGRGMMPIKKLANTIRGKAANDLKPIATQKLPKELTDLTVSVNQLFHRLEKSFEREKRLASDAAHELRNPIAALRLQVENLTAMSPDDNSIQTLKVTTERLSHLAEQILTLNRTDPEVFSAQLIATELPVIVRDVVAAHYSKIEQKLIKIEMDSHKCCAKIDQALFAIMLGNLLENSIKYGQSGNRIKINLFQREKNVFLEVHDSGPGISLEQRSRVLERFYRLDGDRNNSLVSGCGLGLSIVKHIVELHGAKMNIQDSEFGQGVCFQICFNSVELEVDR